MLFKLRFVPEDEAQDIRELLTDNEIDYYETSAGVMGISMPALWLKTDSLLEKAKQLIDEYQEQRAHLAQTEYNTQKEGGTNKSMLDLFKEDPRRFIGYSIAIIALIYFSVIIFINLDT